MDSFDWELASFNFADRGIHNEMMIGQAIVPVMVNIGDGGEGG